VTETHYGADYGAGNGGLHKGRREDCSAPDCALVEGGQPDYQMGSPNPTE
jgi:hypothetical protein